MITKEDAFQIGIHLNFLGSCIPDSKLAEATKHIKMIEDIVLKYMEKEGENNGTERHS